MSISFNVQRGPERIQGQSAAVSRPQHETAAQKNSWDREAGSVSISKEAYGKQAQSAAGGTQAPAGKSEIWGFRPEISESESYGQVIGEPSLSDKAADYYRKLKSKFGNLDFILVDKNNIQAAKAHSSSYGNANHMVVLIDEEKLERMATDESFRKKYEGIIQQAAMGGTGLSQIANTNPLVKGVGINTSDNGAGSFMAVCAKNNSSISERVAARRAEKKAARKEADKKAEKKHREEVRHEKIEERRRKDRERLEDRINSDDDELYEDIDRLRADHRNRGVIRDDLSEYEGDDNYEIIYADSVEELAAKVADYTRSVFGGGETAAGESHFNIQA